jgi:hypothetical protein
MLEPGKRNAAGGGPTEDEVGEESWPADRGGRRWMRNAAGGGPAEDEVGKESWPTDMGGRRWMRGSQPERRRGAKETNCFCFLFFIFIFNWANKWVLYPCQQHV